MTPDTLWTYAIDDIRERRHPCLPQFCRLGSLRSDDLRKSLKYSIGTRLGGINREPELPARAKLMLERGMISYAAKGMYIDFNLLDNVIIGRAPPKGQTVPEAR